MESAKSALSILDLKPVLVSKAFSSASLKMPLRRPVPIKVPIVSKVSERLKAKIVTRASGIFAPSEKSEPRPSFVNITPKVVGRTLTASPRLIVSVVFVTPIKMPIIVVTIMLISIAPLTFISIRIIMRKSPITKRMRSGLLGIAIAGTPAVKFTNFASTKPIKAINTPIPPLIACCRLLGIALMICLRTLVTVMRMLTTPQIKTIDSACCQVNFKVKHTV